MGGDRLLITDVSSRLLAHHIASRYGLLLSFVRPKGSGCTGLVVKTIENSGDSDHLEDLSADKFNSMTVQDLEDMCEYWKMVGVFRHV
jgi:hypothetical protein